MTEAIIGTDQATCCADASRGRVVYVCDTCGRLNLEISASPSQERFLGTEKRIVWLVGPQGEGKTFIGTAALLVHTAKNVHLKPMNPLTGDPVPMRYAFIRDTHENIKRHTVPAIKKAYPGIFTWHDDAHIMRGPSLEMDLFGMDSLNDLTKIQGGEYDGIWIEEPAPIIAQGPSGPMVNAGIPQEVFTVCATRMRGGKTKKRLQITMNPADRSHWTFYQRELNPEWEDVTERIRIRPGENPFLTDEDREAVRKAFKDRPDLYKRYVLGMESETYSGVAITPEYNPDWHKAAFELKPMLGAENFLFFDGGLNPTCVLAQLTPSGRLHLIDCVSLENGGMRQLISSKLIPLLLSPRWEKIRRFRALGDDSLKNREQSDSEFSAAAIIVALLKKWLGHDGYEGGVQAWTLRAEAIKTLLDSNIGGLPRFLVNPITTPGEPWHRIHAALSGGYCYKLVNAQVQKDGPEKNVHSHVGDAITHAIAKLFGIPKVLEDRPPDLRVQRQRASGYAVGAGVYVPGQGRYPR